MPIYDYECFHCNHGFETFAGIDDQHIKCPNCQSMAHRIISCSGHYCSNEDVDWIRSVREVVDKSGGAHCREFMKNPTRQNYKRWINGEGLRPMERGERPSKPNAPSLSDMKAGVQESRQKRNRLEVR